MEENMKKNLCAWILAMGTAWNASAAPIPDAYLDRIILEDSVDAYRGLGLGQLAENAVSEYLKSEIFQLYRGADEGLLTNILEALMSPEFSEGPCGTSRLQRAKFVLLQSRVLKSALGEEWAGARPEFVQASIAAVGLCHSSQSLDSAFDLELLRRNFSDLQEEMHEMQRHLAHIEGQTESLRSRSSRLEESDAAQNRELGRLSEKTDGQQAEITKLQQDLVAQEQAILRIREEMRRAENRLEDTRRISQNALSKSDRALDWIREEMAKRVIPLPYCRDLKGAERLMGRRCRN